MNKIKRLNEIRFELIVTAISIIILFNSPKIFSFLLGYTSLDIYTQYIFTDILAYGITGAFALCMVMKYKNVNISFAEEHASPKILFCGMLCMFFSASLLGCIALVVECFVQADFLTSGNLSADYSVLTRDQKILFGFTAGIFAPIVEEIIFRGVLFNGFRKVYKLSTAAILTGLIFGVLHGTSVYTILGAATAGVILAYVYASKNDICYSIGIHCGYNLFATYLALTEPAESAEAAAQVNVFSEIAFTAFSLICIYGMIVYLCGRVIVKEVRKNNNGFN